MDSVLQYNVGILGVGSVGKTLFQVILKKTKTLADSYKVSFRFVLLADSSGVAFHKNGFNLDDVIQTKQKGGKISSLPGFLPGVDAFDLIMQHSPKIDLLFEASPVNLETGDPALKNCIAALERGIHVVLANKGPLVAGYQRLVETAKKNNVKMMFSATVCGGLPVVNIGRNMICADIELFRGVFNSTTNFILAEMGKGRAYLDALKEAQERGIAETDPSLDVDGWDTANKLLICCFSVLNFPCKLKDIKVEGITGITSNMIQEASKKAQVYKLVATAKKVENGSYELSVRPTLVDENDFLAKTEGWEMGVEIHSDLYGIMYHKMYEREPIATASAMLRDAVNILNR